jgi:LmbE family N-acetylglucosaminyl deacetylase
MTSMQQMHLWSAFLALASWLPVLGATAPTNTLPQLTWRDDDRVLVLAPHPDDEAIACAGVIRQALARKLQVRLVFFTYGDNNEWSFTLYRKHPVITPAAMRAMGEVRHDEALAASTALGFDSAMLLFLGYPDFGTSHIWREVWGSNAVFRSMLTKATTVPYADAFRPGAPYRGEEVLADLTSLLRAFRPTKVFVSHPADQNGDHRALYLFTRVALWNLEHELQPEAWPYLVHFPRWPQKSGWHPTLPLLPPEKLAEQLPWRQLPLSAAAREAKREAIGKHKSQAAYSARYLYSFVRQNELFGDFPVLHPKAENAAQKETARACATPDNEPDDELTEEERNLFVGLVWRHIFRDGDHLVFAIELSRPLARTVQATFSAFGWRPDRPFADQPKLRVVIGEVAHDVFDKDVKLNGDSVCIERRAREIRVRIPLKLLGEPERVLASARTSLAEMPLDAEAWRVLDLSPNDKPIH